MKLVHYAAMALVPETRRSQVMTLLLHAGAKGIYDVDGILRGLNSLRSLHR